MKMVNRKFRRNYEELEKYEAGINLTGAEVKVIREGGLRLDDSYIKIIDNEAYLINAEIPPYRLADTESYDPKRSRKLLLNKAEIIRLKTKIAGSGSLTIVPISCYNKGSLIKLEIALAKGRSDIGKKKLEKAKNIKRQQQKEAKEYIKS